LKIQILAKVVTKADHSDYSLAFINSGIVIKEWIVYARQRILVEALEAIRTCERIICILIFYSFCCSYVV